VTYLYRTLNIIIKVMNINTGTVNISITPAWELYYMTLHVHSEFVD